MRISRTAIASLLCTALLAACGERPRDASAAGDATAATLKANEEFAKAYDLADRQAFEDAARGLVARPAGKITNEQGAVVWDFDSFAFVDGKAPPTVNPSLWRQALLNNQIGLFKVADGIHQLRGFDVSNMTLIEGRTGWIVVDPLTTRETAAAAIAFARKHLGERPVSAMIYTHSHADHFGGALGVLSAAEAAQRKVPVVAPEGFMEEATSENLMAGIAMGRRSNYQFGSRLERSAKGLVDGGIGKALPYGSAGNVGLIAPTRTVSKPVEEITLDGVRFVFQNVPSTEAPAEMTFSLPELKAYCGAEIASQTMHNLYTLRGAKVRDALKWSAYLDEAIDHARDAEVFFASHHWPVWGNARIREFLANQRDVYRFTHDQTVRGMNAGLTPREIAETLRLPKSLDRFLHAHGYYGTVSHNSKAVYQHYLGWYDANPANLNPHPPEEAGKRYVELAGGVDKLVAAAQAAFDRADYRWAAELLNHAVFAEPGHAGAGRLLARTYEQLGYAAESATWRNVYLMGAYELRNGPPASGMTRSVVLDMLRHTPIERFLEAMAGQLDAQAADGKAMKVNLVFTDLKESYVLELRNSILYHRPAPPAPDANATLSMTKEIFLKAVVGTAGLRDTVLNDDFKVEGSRIDLVRFFSLIDRMPGNFAIVTPK
jgi:alkyl sulfatase BDS1-like metallo-beta-lactamase superfamily hydrolase